MPPALTRNFLLRYAVAVAVVALAAAVRASLHPVVGDRLVFLLFFPAVVAAAVYGGPGPGLLATALAALAGTFLLRPAGSPRIHEPIDQLGLALFCLTNGLIVWVCDRHRRAADARARTDQRLAGLLSSMSGFFYLLDRRWRFTFVSPQSAPYFNGHDPAAVLGLTLWDVFPRILGTPLEAEFRRAMAGPDPVHAEVPAVAVPGRWFEVRLYPSPGGGLSVYFYDVTARKRAEAAERAAREQAEHAAREVERASRLKDEFLAIVSHELRTPLNAILGYAQLLRMTPAPDPDTDDALDAIERNAKAQARIVADLLDMSQAAAGRLDLEVRRPVDLAAVLETALESVRPAADARHVRLARHLDPRAAADDDRGGLLVLGDPGRLQQVAANLLANAVKFTPRNGEVRVTLARATGADGDGGHVDLVVADTGQGIPPDFLPHVFEKFRQADGSATRTHGGLGLGLAIVKSLVELHGGTVAAHSDGPGRGATFIVRLPALPTPAVTGPPALPTPPTPADPVPAAG